MIRSTHPQRVLGGCRNQSLAPWETSFGFRGRRIDGTCRARKEPSLLDDTAVKEFLRDDYARVVNEVALAADDLTAAEDAVQEALVRAWTRSERGDRIASFPDWTAVVAKQIARGGWHRLFAEHDTDGRSLPRSATDAATSRPVSQPTFEHILRKKSHYEMVKRARGGALALGIVAVTALAVLAMSRPDATRRAGPTPSPSAEPHVRTVGASIPGVPFPACDPSSGSGNFEGGRHGVVYLFARGEGLDCPEVVAGRAFLSIDRRGQGRPADTLMSRPIECAIRCRIFGTPDLNGDGRSELAVVVSDAWGVDVLEIYRFSPDDATVFNPLMVENSSPLYPWWGGSGRYRYGASCRSNGADADIYRLDLWRTSRRRGVWHVRETLFRGGGSTLGIVRTVRWTTSDEDALPAGGGTDFCGAQVSP